MKFSKYNIIHTTENQEHILFNSLWGSTFVISPSVKQAIESSNPTLLTEEENRLFIKYNALIPDEYNESCIYNHFYNKSRYGKKCLTATVLLTWSCNFRCIYCYEGAGELRCENMTKNRAGAIANFLIKCSEEQRGELIHVVLFGGEPLLNLCNLNRWQLQGALGYANIQILAHSRSLEILHCQQSCRRSSAFLQRAFCP